MSRFPASLVFYCFLSIVFFGGDVLAQDRTGPFAPPVGQSGTTALHEDSSAFVAWATQCTVERGLQDTSDPSLGYASSGMPENATGPASSDGIVSLGDHGMATLRFDVSVRNGAGPDLAVFENSFNDSFLELAFVEVSSNGQDFVRFPPVSLTDTSTQVGTFGSLDATDLYNLAGKYRGGYGTPFDLEELAGSPSLDIDSITVVRIVDVIGCVQDSFATYDSTGRAVNDPWPTDFASSGFDLDAVGVIHSNSSTGWERNSRRKEWTVHYDRSEESISIYGLRGRYSFGLYDVTGRLLLSREGSRSSRFALPRSIENGVHILRVEKEGRIMTRKILVR